MNNKKEHYENDKKEYTEEFQKLLIQFMVSSEEAFTRCQNILKANYFDAKFRNAVKYILKFADQYSALPTAEQLNGETGVGVEKIENIQKNHIEWFLNEIEQFCRYKALEFAIHTAPDKLDRGQYTDVETDVKNAILVSLQKDLGTTYFKNVKERLMKLRDREGIVSTGWRDIDSKLYGGFAKGGLNIFAGGSGCVIASTKIRVIELINIPDDPE
jgi:hypothetical protein